MIQRILEHARDGPVVLGRDEQQSMRRGDFVLEAFDRIRRIGIVVLVVQRQVVDARGLEAEVGRTETAQRRRQLLVE